ncbi:MAG: hypothetical protein CSA74_10345 [Rhodobacterales bacterium]|nr:MAG: hypothetical protein CSA74_10345 [Rhodobacterales bacterium]
MGHETYLYGRGGGTGIWFLLFFAIVILGGAGLAMSSAEGIWIGDTHFGPEPATLVYLGIAALGGWLAWSEVQGERFEAKTQHPIELGSGEIIAPAAPDGRRMVSLSYDGITELKVDAGKGEPWLYITHRNGKLSIASEAMESYTAFQRMLTSLELRVTMAQVEKQAVR